MKKEYKKWILIGVITLFILMSQSQDKKEFVPFVLGAGPALSYAIPTATLGAGVLSTSTGFGATWGIPLMIIGGVWLLFMFIGYQWLTSNFIWIAAVILVIIWMKMMGSKRRGY